MKKILSVIVVMSVLAMTGCASAPKNIAMDGKLIVVTDESTVPFLSDRALKKADLADGLFVRIAGNMYDKTVYPNADVIVKERFTSRGIKLAETESDSSVIVKFYLQGSASLADIEKSANHATHIDSAELIVNGGIVAGNYISMGPVALAGAAVGLMFDQDKKTFIASLMTINPRPAITVNGVNKASIEKTDIVNGISVKYKLEKGKEARDEVVLKVLVDSWINKYIVLDPQPSTPVAAALPAVVAVGEEAKK